MAAAQELSAQLLAPVQSGQGVINPPTIASAATIAPTTRMSFISGTVQVATITPPIAGYHELVLIFTNGSPGALLTTGNIKAAATPAQWVPLILVYDPSTALYYAGVPS